jgi:hypothetical protein
MSNLINNLFLFLFLFMFIIVLHSCSRSVPFPLQSRPDLPAVHLSTGAQEISWPLHASTPILCLSTGRRPPAGPVESPSAVGHRPPPSSLSPARPRRRHRHPSVCFHAVAVCAVQHLRGGCLTQDPEADRGSRACRRGGELSEVCRRSWSMEDLLTFDERKDRKSDVEKTSGGGFPSDRSRRRP